MKTAELLVNTRSRLGGSTKVSEIVDALQKAGIHVNQIHKITKNNTFDDVVKKIADNKPKLLVVASGDGTLSSIVDKLAGTPIELGVIPLGTTNNFARSLDIPFDMAEAVDVIKTKRARPIDLGSINGQFFTNVAGIGLSARIASNVKHSQKQRWGRLAYAYTALRSVITQKPFRITIEDPDKELSITIETRQFIIANGRYHSGKEIAQDNSISNGKLVLFALGGASRASLIRHTLDFYFGSREKIAHASYFVGKNVRLKTSSPQSVELDGEVRMKLPVEVRIETSAVRVRY